MNKNIKRIIVATLVMGMFSGVTPATNINLLTSKAYASSSDADELDSIDLQDSDGESLDIYKDSNYDNEADDDLLVGHTYYTETTTSAVTIESVSGTDDDKVRIFRGSDVYEVGESIPVDDGTTTLKVRVYEDDYDEDEDYKSSDYNEYIIKVKYDDEDDDSSSDEDTLESLELQDKNGDTINLYSGSDYDEVVDSDSVDEGDTYYAKTSSDIVRVETSGPSDKYVRIFKSTSDSAKGIEIGDDISVSEDKTLTIRVYSEEPDDDIEYSDDDDVIGEYKIKLKYTGDESSSGTTTDSSSNSATNVTNNITGNPSISGTANSVSTIKANQWVQNSNGVWQYNDSLGNPLKSQWFFDKNYGKWYYLGADGIMSSNTWILTNGKYYYVGSDGSMEANTMVGIYKVGADGAWIQ